MTGLLQHRAQQQQCRFQVDRKIFCQYKGQPGSLCRERERRGGEDVHANQDVLIHGPIDSESILAESHDGHFRAFARLAIREFGNIVQEPEEIWDWK